jgi:hypothetical protein
MRLLLVAQVDIRWVRRKPEQQLAAPVAQDNDQSKVRPLRRLMFRQERAWAHRPWIPARLEQFGAAKLLARHRQSYRCSMERLPLLELIRECLQNHWQPPAVRNWYKTRFRAQAWFHTRYKERRPKLS